MKAQLREAALGITQQIAMPLYRKYAAAQAGEDRCLITGTGADLENLVPFAEIELFGHQRHDIGLADRLAATDGQGHILIGLIRERWGDKSLAGRPLDRSEHPRVGDPDAAQLHQEPQFLLDQARVDRDGSARGHPKTFFSEASTGTLVRLR